MANPIKRLRGVLGILLLAAGGVVAWYLTKAEIQPAAPIVVKDATQPVVPGPDGNPTPTPAPESTTCLEKFKGERLESMRGLSAGLACEQDDGSWLMEDDVSFRLSSAEGEPPITVTSKKGVLPPDADGAAPLVLTGDVLVETEDGFRLETQELELYRATSRVLTRTPVKFSRGETSGHAARLEHHWEKKETLLDGGATVLLAGEELGERPITVKGRSIKLIDEKALVEVRGQGSIDLDGGRVSGERIDALFTADRKSVERVESSGGAETLAAGSGFGLQGGSVATRRLRAGRIVHLLGPDNDLRSIEAESSVVLSGSAIGAGGRASTELLQGDWALMSFTGGKESRLRSIEAKGQPARLLSEEGADRREAVGSRVELGMRRDGSLERLAATTEATLLFRSSEGERRIEGDEVEVGLEGERLDSLRFRGAPARLRQQGGGGPARSVTAPMGDVLFGADGRPSSGTLEGGVEMVSGEYRATGKTATVSDAGQTLTLEGQAALISAGRESHGDRVVYREAEQRVSVEGDQHTILSDAVDGSSLGDFVSGDEPVLISAERMDVDLETRKVVYSAPGGGGRPDIRQGDVALRGDVITLDEALGDLLAEGSVESKLRLSQPDGRARAPGEGLFDPTALITGTCQTFRYRKADQVVVYDGEASLEQGEMVLQAEQVEVGLKGEGSEVEYLKARRKAYYKGTDFEAEGELIDYRQSENLVRIEGGRRPARAVRSDGDLATGGELELDLDEDGIRITAPHGGRTRGVSPRRLDPAEQGQGQ